MTIVKNKKVTITEPETRLVEMNCAKCKKLVSEVSETDMCCFDCTSDKSRMRDFDTLWSLCAEVMADECENTHRAEERGKRANGSHYSHKGNPTCVCWLPEALILMTPRERKKYGVHIFSDWVPVLSEAYRRLIEDIYNTPYGETLGVRAFRDFLKGELLEKKPNTKLTNLNN
jgi:hypothetical protein